VQRTPNEHDYAWSNIEHFLKDACMSYAAQICRQQMLLPTWEKVSCVLNMCRGLL